MKMTSSALNTLLLLTVTAQTAAWQAGQTSALRVQRPLFRLRGGAHRDGRTSVFFNPWRTSSPKPHERLKETWHFGNHSGLMKLNANWTGDIADFSWGCTIGLGGGFVVGRWLRWVAATITQSVVGLPVFCASHVTFLFVVNSMLVRSNIITINYARLGAHPLVFKRVRPISKRFDMDGDGLLTWSDLEILLNKLLGRRIGTWLSKQLRRSGLDQDGDGRFTKEDIQLLIAGNEHGSLGVEVGSGVGVLVGCLTHPLQYQRLSKWTYRLARMTAVVAIRSLGVAASTINTACHFCLRGKKPESSAEVTVGRDGGEAEWGTETVQEGEAATDAETNWGRKWRAVCDTFQLQSTRVTKALRTLRDKAVAIVASRLQK